MFKTSHLARPFALASLLAAAAFVPGAQAVDPFSLRSDTFKDGTLMPRRVANNTAGNANCVGENVSPHLAWSGVPDGTKSFVSLVNVIVDPVDSSCFTIAR